MNAAPPDPIAQAAHIIAKGQNDHSLEKRLKSDLYHAIIKIKPERAENIDFDQDVLSGHFFAQLPTNLQGIAVLKLESAIGFYHRLGFHPHCLEHSIEVCLEPAQVAQLSEKYQCQNLHDLSYIPHKQLEKAIGKDNAAALYERFQTYVQTLQSPAQPH